MKASDRVDGRVPQQLVLDEHQPFSPFIERRPERDFTAPPPARAEQVAGADEQHREKCEHISHSPALF